METGFEPWSEVGTESTARAQHGSCNNTNMCELILTPLIKKFSFNPVARQLGLYIWKFLLHKNQNEAINCSSSPSSGGCALDRTSQYSLNSLGEGTRQTQKKLPIGNHGLNKPDHQVSYTMTSHDEASPPVNHGQVLGPYIENVACPKCSQLNPRTTDTCFGCGALLTVNA